MCFLVLWPFCWSTTLVHFKIGPEYLTTETTQVFIPYMRFLQCSLVSSCLLLLLFTLLEFFTSVLADGFSLEFEWEHISSRLQDSSQYSGRSHQCCHLDSFYPSANVRVPKAQITIDTIVTFMFHSFLNSSKVEILILLFTFFQFHSVVYRDRNFHFGSN